MSKAINNKLYSSVNLLSYQFINYENLKIEISDKKIKFENVKLNKWNSGKLGISAITSRKYLKGYCQPPLKTKKLKQERDRDLTVVLGKGDVKPRPGELEPGYEEGEDADKDFEITLENYIPNNCSGTITPSKGGYKRNQLFNFGKNYLKIPYTQLTKPSGEPLQKPELCRIINAKYREFKKRGKDITDEDRLKAYEKNIDDCENGESKGGYGLNDLKELAINYYDIGEDEIKDMNKPQICTHIRNKLNLIKKHEDGEDIADIAKVGVGALEQAATLDYKLGDTKNMIYPGDINNCKETPNRGGFTIKKIKKIASTQFGIATEHKHKDEICDEMEGMLKENKKVIGRKSKEQRETRLSANKIHQLRDSFSDLFEDPSIAAEPDLEEDEARPAEEASRSSSQIKPIKNANDDEA